MPEFQLDDTDRRLLNILQTGFPLAGRPYLEIAGRLGVSEQDVIQRVGVHRSSGLVREISAIFSTRRLGYRTTLVAMRLPADRLDERAHIVSAHPGVSHNYAREGPFNLWFTLAVPPEGDLEAEVERLSERVASEATLSLPAIKVFKIGVHFDMVNEEPGASGDRARAAPSDACQDCDGAPRLSARDIALVRELQEDLEPVPRPFDPVAQRLGLTVPELLEHAAGMKARGLMRRYGAVLRHREAGFTANAMVVWSVPPRRSEEVGTIMARFPAVSHCYQRASREDWPYTHYTMIHAASRQRCEQIAGEIETATGIGDRQSLYSTR
ncbi:MAG: AsnC family transcriptional regulator, partial [Gemmatimonadetes bacterium]|nr:AsnC family transcriptional regulator [Gemmatimonadota bacterium]